MEQPVEKKKRFFARLKDNFMTKFWRNQEKKAKLYAIIFGSDTPAGKRFDVVLMIMIVASILVMMIESSGIPHNFKFAFMILEYVFTAFFTFEYLARIYCSPQPRKYIFSFYGIVDLLSTLPVYLGFIFGGARYLLAIRVFRLIRVFRVFKLFSFLNEGYSLMIALRDSMRKIIVFFLFVVILVICIGSIMYMIEGTQENSRFSNIFTSIYWAIVTMTTVGYGDITPTTSVGRFLSAIVMLLGYTIIAVPTGIVSASMAKNYKNKKDEEFRICTNCHNSEYDKNAKFCKHCGKELENNWKKEHPAERIIRNDKETSTAENAENEINID